MKKNIIILFLLFYGMSLLAQDFNSDLKAFRESIELEIKGDYSKAVESLKQNYSSASYEFNLRLGWLDYLAGQYIESTTYYQKALSLKPMSIEARNGIVHPLLALGKTDMVIKMYKEILEISPNETSANYRLALIYYQKGQYKEAEKHLLLVINFFPFDYDTVVLLGWNYYRMGKFNDAKILFQKALLFKPNDESASEGLKLVN
jgi:tetratricopeptide (TPR) repeat protein